MPGRGGCEPGALSGPLSYAPPDAARQRTLPTAGDGTLSHSTSIAALFLAAGIGAAGGADEPAAASPWARVDPYVARPRVIVMTDIANEPDDQMSLVRFLLYSNQFDVEGLVATTSTWMKDR